MANPICVDLSHWNPEPNWQQLKNGGTQGVILKATQGTGYTDPTFNSRRVAAIQAGLPVIAYHYLEHGNVQAQISHYLAVLKPAEGERVIIDYEEAGCTIGELRAAAQQLANFGKNLQVTVYGGSVLEQQLGSSRDEYLAENTSLWTAQYTNASAPSWPTGTWPVWSLWQYTDAATVQGISAPVDGNRFNGSSTSFDKWFRPASAAPAIGHEIVPPVVAISVPAGVVVEVTTTTAVPLSVTVDGEPWGPL